VASAPLVYFSVLDFSFSYATHRLNLSVNYILSFGYISTEWLQDNATVNVWVKPRSSPAACALISVIKHNIRKTSFTSLDAACQVRIQVSSSCFVYLVSVLTWIVSLFLAADLTCMGVWNSLSDELKNFDSFDGFKRFLKTILFSRYTIVTSALEVFWRDALYKSTFYLLTYLLILTIKKLWSVGDMAVRQILCVCARWIAFA